MEGETTEQQRRPWWLAGGWHVCEHCLQRYAVEVEYRCVACDGPVCPLCVVVVRAEAEVFCPDCAPAGGTEG